MFCLDLVQPYVTILDRLMSKVLVDVNVLCPLPATKDLIQPFNAGCVVLEYLCVTV